MASAALSSFLLPHPTTLCPPPLQFRKKTCRATIRRRILCKSTHCQDRPIDGPLDDIIAEIKSDIWNLPPDRIVGLSSLDWGNLSKAPSTWAVTPLPVSRAPSNQPLTIRKNRNSRSSASDSSMGDQTYYSRNNSQDEIMKGGAVGMPLLPGTTPWPVFDATASCEPTRIASPFNTTVCTDPNTAQQSLEKAVERADGQFEYTKQRRPSRLRLFTNGFPRLRRTGTGDSSPSTGDAFESISPTTVSLLNPKGSNDCQDADEPSDEAVEAYMKRNAHNCTKLRAIMDRMAKRLPTPVEDEHELPEGQATVVDTMPTTLRAAVRTFPEVKILTEDSHEFSIAVEIEGVLHNSSTLPNATIDVVFVVDNGYYVTKECLGRATDAINGALYHMRRGDRMALYTTHCVHNAVTGNKPELHYPLRPFTTDSEDIFYGLTTSICQSGTQTWMPPRPNPSMTDVVLGVAKSLEDHDLKPGRTHIILLSPTSNVLHDVSKTFPELSIHRINPATLPYRQELELQDTVCFESCCRNVFVSNWCSYQAVPGRIKRILKNARFKTPVGGLTNLSIDMRTRDGCELIECFGRKDVPHLRLGQVHTFFAHIRVDRQKTRRVDLDSINPIFNSSLDVKGLRQELQNAVALGATKVHILDVQIYHRNSINTVDCWNYTETPVVVVRELGGLAPPVDTTLEVLRRQYFHKFAQLTIDDASIEVDNLLAILDLENEVARNMVECMSREIRCQEAIRKYENDYRQKLPLCPGPIEIEPPHEWLLDLWSRRKSKRNGVAGTGGGIAGLVDGLHGLERHT